MKKITKKMLLPVIALLGLASCGGQTVKPEVAKQRAQKIAEVQKSEDFELPKKLYIDEEAVIKGEMVSPTGTEKTNVTVSSLFSLDLENFQVYMSLKGQGETDKQKNYSSEIWFYLEDNTFYTVSDIDGEKNYTKVTVEINNFNFSEAAANVVNQVYDLLTSEDYLNLDQYTSGVNNEVTEGFKVDFGTPSVTYTSTGDGNLGITQKASINTKIESEGVSISAKGSSTLKVQFDNYILSSLSSNCNVDLNAGGESVSLEAKSNTNVHLNSTQFSKPNLSDFTEKTVA